MAETLIELHTLTQKRSVYNDPDLTWLSVWNGDGEIGEVIDWGAAMGSEYKSFGSIDSWNFTSLYMRGISLTGAQYSPTGVFSNITAVKLRIVFNRACYMNGNTPVSACDTFNVVAAPALSNTGVYEYLKICTSALGSCSPPYEPSYSVDHVVEIDLTESGIDWNGQYGFGFRFSHEIAGTPPTAGCQQFARWNNAYIVITGDISPAIRTKPATGVDFYFAKATLNGESYGMSSVYFLCGLDDPPTGSTSKIPAAPSFSIILHRLARNRTYYFQAVGIDTGGTKYYGDILSFEVVLPPGDPAYVTKLVIHGQPLVPLQTVTLSATDADSIAKYGRRTYSLNTQFSLSQDDTQIILDEILIDNKDPRVNNLIITFQNLRAGELKDSVIAADISTRITLINTRLGINADYFINNVKHTVADAGASYTVQWRLERIYD